MATEETSAGKFKGIPVWSDSQEPVLDNPLGVTTPDDWLPSNKPAEHLLRIYHILGDIQACLRSIQATANQREDNLRGRRDLTTKECILEAEIELLQSSLNECRERIQNTSLVGAFRNYRKKMRPHVKELTVIRNKLGAHYDKQTSSHQVRGLWDQVRKCDLATPLMLMLAVTYEALRPDVCGWSRRCSGKDHWCLMTVDGVIVHFTMNGEVPQMIGGVTFCNSPKLTIAALVRDTMALVRSTFAVRGLPRLVDDGDTGGGGSMKPKT